METTVTDIKNIDRLNEEAWSIVRSNPRKCIEKSKQILLAAENAGYAEGIAHALSCIGGAKVWLSQYDEALKTLYTAREAFQVLGDKKREAEVVYHIFCSYFFLADYDKALQFANQILTLASENNDTNAKANAYNGIGTIYYTIGENEKSIENLQLGLELAEKGDDKHLLARITDGIGTAYLQLYKLDNALYYKERSWEAARESGRKNEESYALNGLASVYHSSGNQKKAEEFYKAAIILRKEIDFKPGVADSLSLLGSLYLDEKRDEEALNCLNEALHVATDIDSKEYLYKIHYSLSCYYERKKDFSEYKKHLALYFSNKEYYTNEQNRQKLKTAEMQMKMERVEKEKEILEKKHKEVEKTARHTKMISGIGKEIASLLSVEDIIETVYKNINELMDADAFGIGIYRSEQNDLFHTGVMEKSKKLPDFSFPLNEERIASVCFHNVQEIIINDWNREYRQYISKNYSAKAGEAPVSMIYMPLLAGTKVIGVMSVQSFKINAYSSYHLDIVRSLSLYIGSAIENANLYRQLEDRVKARTAEIEKAYENTRLLSRISKEISSSLSVETIIEIVYKNINQLMDADGFGIGLLDKSAGQIHFPGYIEKGEKINFSIDTNDDRLATWCLNKQKQIFINNFPAEYSKYLKLKQAPKAGKDSSSIIYLPLYFKDTITGVITVQSFQVNAYTEYHLDILKNLGQSIASALENARLYESMEDAVKTRTDEVVKQKEQIEKAFSNTKVISEIGREIASLLSAAEIISKLYTSVNTLLDATIFGVALYRENENDLYFSGVMEKGELLPDFSYPLTEEKIATLSFRNRQEIIINDWEKEFQKYIHKDYDAIQGDLPESMIYMPVYSKHKVIGVITAQSFKKNAYNVYHTDVLRSLSVYVGSALENASLYEDLEERVKERTAEIEKAYQNTKLLSSISKEISSSLSVETIVANVYRNVNELMDAASFGIGIFNPATRMIDFPGFIEKGVQHDNVYFHVDDDRLAGWCFRNQKEIVTNDYTRDYNKYVKGIKAVVAGKHSQSIIYLPLFTKEKIIGTLTIQSYELNAYSDYHLDILRNLANSISIAIDNATLYANLEEKVKERTAEVVKQKEIIEEKNKHITDSIIYAKRIQRAILPPEEIFSAYLKSSFVLYKPKDIVSGDFYWIERKEKKILFAVVDCTGHGVPGAFMSIIGYNGLNQIVNEYNITQPAEILNRLNSIISNTLKQHADHSKIRDGMDISVCCIDLDSNKLEFAGANNPIFILRNGNVMEVKADKHPIGNFVGEKEFHFTNKEIELFSDDQIYLFSDGYADQFGGPRGKKFKYTQFRDLLLQHRNKSMRQQKEILDALFEEWRGDLEQIDDVCVIGVRI